MEQDPATNNHSFLQIRNQTTNDRLAFFRLSTPNNPQGADTAELFAGGGRGLFLRKFGADLISFAPLDVTSLTITSTSVNVLTQFNNSSDAKLKDDQQDADLDECQTLLKSVRVKTYVRNDFESKQRRLGFIAQDVEQAASTLHLGKNLTGSFTTKNEAGESNTFKTLDYSRLVCMFWGACQKLSDRVAHLESKLQ